VFGEVYPDWDDAAALTVRAYGKAPPASNPFYPKR
jgi:hypothetical protein